MTTDFVGTDRAPVMRQSWARGIALSVLLARALEQAGRSATDAELRWLGAWVDVMCHCWVGIEFGDRIDGVEAVGLAMLAWTLG